jgi:hypothetical protein
MIELRVRMLHPPRRRVKMPPKYLLRKWPSLSTAAAVLLGLHRTEARTTDTDIISDSGKRDSFEPLVLKPSDTKVIPAHLFAGHSSHSSHSSGSSSGHASHASHSSGTSSGVYTPRAPSYIAPLPPRSNSLTAPRYTAPTTPRTAAEITPPQIASARIELTNGAVIYGTVLVKSTAGITLRGLDQKSYKIPRLILASSTITSLALPPDQ